MPVFLPFAGCPRRCVFCAQDKQSATPETRDSFQTEQALSSLEKRLQALESIFPLPFSLPHSRELAFYGGTFTALSAPVRRRCLGLYQRHHQSGLLSHARCSTRPDAVDASILAELRQAGLDLVELGIQSFDSAALRSAQRGYDGTQAWAGCLSVHEAGLNLGIQLLPGMPGVSPAVFLEDARKAISLRPMALRFYPCLVPEGTTLANLWRQGLYQPWSLEETVSTLGQALALAWEAEIPVIRLAVAPEPDFDRALLAGPRHPSLGSLIQAEALRQTVCKAMNTMQTVPCSLHLPKRCQGYMYGHQGKLKAWWDQIGLPSHTVHFDTPLSVFPDTPRKILCAPSGQNNMGWLEWEDQSSA